MKRLSTAVMTALVISLTSTTLGYADTIDLTPDQFTWEAYSPAKIVVTANKLIELGPQDAYASLLRFADKPVNEHQPMADEDQSYYVAWLCLLIYDPKPNSGLPWPEFGGPGFPQTGAFESRPLGWMNSATWPRFPIALSRNIPFLLVEGYYTLAGHAEPGSFFLKRCQTNGVFHSTSYPVPNHAETETALNSLISSPEWKALFWHEANPPNNVHDFENLEINFLRRQVESVK